MKQSQAPPLPAHPGAVLAVLSVAAFVASLDLFIVNVAFDDIGRSLDEPSLGRLSWVLNGYAIVYAALLVPLGRLADRYGRRAGFLAGLGLFTAASVGCALAGNVPVLIGFRVLQAVGAAALTPTSLGLLLTTTEPSRRVRAVRTWASMGGVAAAAGPVVGGLLVELSWRWVFLVNVPIGLLTLVAALRLVPESRDHEPGPVPDLLGAAIAAVSVGALVLAVVQGPEWGWTSAAVLGWLGLAAVGLLVVARRSSRHPSPLVEPALLAVRSFRWSNLTAVLFTAAFSANLLAMVLWLQQVEGLSALRTGLAVTPGPCLVPVFAALANRLEARGLTVGRVAAIGCVSFALGTGLLALRLGPDTAYATHLLPSLLLTGAGVGLALPSFIAAATGGLPPGRTSTGSAVVTMSRQLGAALGVAGLVALLGSEVATAAGEAAFHVGWASCAALALAAGAAALRMSPDPPGGADRTTAAAPITAEGATS